MRVLVVDDDPQFVSTLSRELQGQGHEVVVATEGLTALQIAYETRPDVVLLDILIPKLNGLETCRRLRDISGVPIVILSALGKEADVVRGLNAGADDYLVKPFSMAELAARLEAMLRRMGSQGAAQKRVVYDDGVLYVDLERHIVQKRGKRIPLSPREFQLLTCLVRNAGRVVPHEELLSEVWGAGYEGELSYLALYIFYLRQKIEDDPSQPDYIQTRFRVGYYLRGNKANAESLDDPR